MQGYQTDHKIFSFALSLPEHLKHLSSCKHVICRTNLKKIFANIVVRKSRGKVMHRLFPLNKTPHYQFLKGNEGPYKKYLAAFGKSVGYGIEHSVEAFRELIHASGSYLDAAHSSQYIICSLKKTIFGHKPVILDGVHRGCLLLRNNITEVPVAFLIDEKNEKLFPDQFDQYLDDFKDDFLEWYTPIALRNRTIHERTYPDFKQRKEFLSNKERGQSKWEYIIKRNLPDVHGKTICDIGCNVGLFSILLARMGAKLVDGFDRGTDTVQPTNPGLPRQSVVQQAYFVKNLFGLAGYRDGLNVNYFECDLARLDFSTLNYDMLFSCCVLYHFGEKFEQFIARASRNIPEIFLQTNLGHTTGDLSRYASIAYHDWLLKKYGYDTRIDAPIGYNYPIIYGKKT